jgi:hypothetical protein
MADLSNCWPVFIAGILLGFAAAVILRSTLG